MCSHEMTCKCCRSAARRKLLSQPYRRCTRAARSAVRSSSCCWRSADVAAAASACRTASACRRQPLLSHHDIKTRPSALALKERRPLADGLPSLDQDHKCLEPLAHGTQERGWQHGIGMRVHIPPIVVCRNFRRQQHTLVRGGHEAAHPACQVYVLLQRGHLGGTGGIARPCCLRLCRRPLPGGLSFQRLSLPPRLGKLQRSTFT
jgi:hypothetical protein